MMLSLNAETVRAARHAWLCCLFSFVMLSSIEAQYPPVQQVRTHFKSLLERPRTDPRPSFIKTENDTLVIERGYFYSEQKEQVPVLIYKPRAGRQKSFPVVICLHGTGGSKDEGSIKMLMERFAKQGMMAVAIDARFHGERIPGGAHGSREYTQAIKAAWQNDDTARQTHPFFFDTVYDCWRLVDYLVTRTDVQAGRIGMMGISMGGIETWMAASTDKRIRVAVPIIAVQSFRWSLEHQQWQGRARTIWNVHEQVAKELGDSAVNENNVLRFWDKLLPGITGEFDCPSMIRLFAPRPLLLLNNQLDPNCPLPGAEIAFTSATKAYALKKSPKMLKTDVSPNEPHRLTPRHVEMTLAWFKKWL